MENPRPTAILAENPNCNSLCKVCHYKNMDYPAQLVRKTTWARTQLGRWGESLREIIPAPPSEQIAYRSKSWLRSEYKEGRLSFGMHRSIRVANRWEQEFISWDTCPLHVQAIREMILKFKQALPLKLPDFIEKSLVGLWVGSPHVVLISNHPISAEIEKMNWSELLVPPFDRIWFHCNPQVGRKIFGHHEIRLLTGPQDSGIHPIRAFRQVAQSLLVEARARALQHLLASNPELVLDLYCGTGDLLQSLPPSVRWIGVESSKEAILFANSLDLPHRAKFEGFIGTVEDRLRDPRVLNKIEGRLSLYVNPPRSGLSEEARSQILFVVDKHAPEKIAYLSCSASSLSRDLRAFEDAGYRIDLLQPFDFFPQTEHFETLALLTRE